MTDFDEKSLEELENLCKIACNEDEKKAILKNMRSILSYIDMLSEVDTQGVTECCSVNEEEMDLREDEIQSELNRDTFLANSPSHTGGMVKVPTVIQF